MKVRLIVCLLFTFSFISYSQTEYHFLVHFRFKKSSLDLSNPNEFLSEKSILIKSIQNAAIDSSDLPLNTNFINAIKEQNQVLEAKSKWFNAIVISNLDSNLTGIESFDFIRSVEYLGQRGLNKKTNNKLKYGVSENQNKLTNVNFLHNLGYTGDGVSIAVIDAGFKNANTILFFNSLFIENRILGNYDFVNNRLVNYNGHSHGTSVLSTMAANSDKSYIGSAPNSNYILLVSEDVNQENLIEEFHFIEALEYADSFGVDIINSSLGYSIFDTFELSHAKDELTGDSAYISKACNFASKKGMLIITSAGNYGASAWKNISFPADADSVVTVGSVNELNKYSEFSSNGIPIYNGLIKPNLCSIGESIAFVNGNGQTQLGNGTSFSAPQITGLFACLKQAFPNKNNWELKKALEESASNFNTPDSLIGFGVPDAEKAYWILNKQSDLKEPEQLIFPNPTSYSVMLINKNNISSVKLFNLEGRLVYENYPNSTVFKINVSFLSTGVFILKTISNKKELVQKIMIY